MAGVDHQAVEKEGAVVQPIVSAVHPIRRSLPDGEWQSGSSPDVVSDDVANQAANEWPSSYHHSPMAT